MMLLRVTLTNPRHFNKVTSGQALVNAVYLPAGQYIFRVVPNPINNACEDWAILHEPQSYQTDWSAEDIIGASYPYMLFWCRQPVFGAFNDHIIQMEEIVEAIEPIAASSSPEKQARPLAKIITLPLPPFAHVHKRRHYQAPPTTLPIIKRKRWHPAAHRMMSCS